MKTESQQLNEREGAASALNAAIESLNPVKTSCVPPAKAIFGSVIVLLTLIRDSMVNRLDCVELGLFCADVCRALDRVTNGKKLDELSQSVYDAMNQLTPIVTEIQRVVVKWGKRNAVSRHFQAKNDKETIATWRSNLDETLQIFNREPTIKTNATISAVRHDVADSPTTVSGVKNDVNTRVTVSDSHRIASKRPEDTHGQNQMTHASAPGESPAPLPRSADGTDSEIRRGVRVIVSEIERNVTSTLHRTTVQGQEGNGSRHPLTQTSIPGEAPPLPSRIFFGRDELIEKIVDLAQNLIPIALIGAGGIGKTSIALAVLHHDRIKQRFGQNRRFIRCDKFPASHTHLLQRLSNVIGAGIENPKNLTPLRTFLSSREMLIVLDNAESILDPRGKDAEEIYNVVEELSRFDNICLCMTSRISTTPPDCKRFDVPTLSMDAARDTFYRIYDSDTHRSNVVNTTLEQLDFHPLSITLLATVAHQNKWNMNRLAREWERRRTSVLQTQHNKSLAATVELSLASPMFQELGPDARALLGVVAFFPRGVDENNLEWLFPAILNRTDIFDKFCVLSLTYRSGGFFTMLAPLRDYLIPKDPKASPLLCATKEHYFARLSVIIDPDKPNFGESQWIRSEDVNVEHLLDVFTTIDANSDDVWNACSSFMAHLYWHKKRLTILKPKIEGLPDNHHSKPNCLYELSRLFSDIGDRMEQKRLLIHTLKLSREWRGDSWVATILAELSDTNRLIGLLEEGISQAEEALEIVERLGDTALQTDCLASLALLLLDDNQLDAAEEAALRALDLLPEKGKQFQVCESHRALGNISQSKGEVEKAIHHYEEAIRIASPFNRHEGLFWIHYRLAGLFYNQGRFDDAHAHLEHAKLHTVNSAYFLGLAMEEQAWVWCRQRKLEEAKHEFLRAADTYEKAGAAKEMEDCRRCLQELEKALNTSVASG